MMRHRVAPGSVAMLRLRLLVLPGTPAVVLAEEVGCGESSMLDEELPTDPDRGVRLSMFGDQQRLTVDLRHLRAHRSWIVLEQIDQLQ